MDGVVDTKLAIELGKLSGLGVLNLDGIYTRYKNPYEQIKKIVNPKTKNVTEILQKIYKEPVKDELIYERIKEIKKSGVVCAVSSIPQNAQKNVEIAKEAGADIFVIQATVVTVNHYSSRYENVNLEKICKESGLPIIIGNCVTYNVALQLMEIGASAVLVGVGPGAACTTRQVLGIGVPQVTATVDCAKARDYFFKKTGK
jgi:IMP dehydrogenase